MKLFTFLGNWMMMSTAADIFCFLKFVVIFVLAFLFYFIIAVVCFLSFYTRIFLHWVVFFAEAECSVSKAINHFVS